MNFLNVRLVVNGKNIYQLLNNRPVVIPLEENRSEIVATDGFHISRPLKLHCDQRNACRLQVVCAINNDALAACIILLLLFSMVGVISEIYLMKLLSFTPIFYFLFSFYINRSAFIQIKPEENYSIVKR